MLGSGNYGFAALRGAPRNDEIEMTPEEMLARLLYRDGLMLVIDKPAGFAVHRGPKGGEALDDFFEPLCASACRAIRRWRIGSTRIPPAAWCSAATARRSRLLGKLFKQGKVGKTYWAVVEGGPEAEQGRIDIALSKRDETRGWWMKPDPQGLPSATTWTVMGRANLGTTAPQTRATSPLAGEVAAEGGGRGVAARTELASTPLPTPPPQGGREQAAASGKSSNQITWLALEPLTGRTHQLRVHCAEMGWPIVGDTIYGSAPRQGGPPLHLHAREVTVPISKNKPPVNVVAPVPAHMRELLSACGWRDQ